MGFVRWSALTAVFTTILRLADPAALVCSPRSFGAKTDGRVKDTKAIQAAIDDCARRGGGTVELSGGVYLSAPIVLKSHITLQIDQGATLLGSSDESDYPETEAGIARSR